MIVFSELIGDMSGKIKAEGRCKLKDFFFSRKSSRIKEGIKNALMRFLGNKAS